MQLPYAWCFPHLVQPSQVVQSKHQSAPAPLCPSLPRPASALARPTAPPCHAGLRLEPRVALEGAACFCYCACGRNGVGRAAARGCLGLGVIGAGGFGALQGWMGDNTEVGLTAWASAVTLEPSPNPLPPPSPLPAARQAQTGGTAAHCWSSSRAVAAAGLGCSAG